LGNWALLFLGESNFDQTGVLEGGRRRILQITISNLGDKKFQRYNRFKIRLLKARK